MQAIKHNADLLFSRVVLPGCPPDISDKRLGRRRIRSARAAMVGTTVVLAAPSRLPCALFVSRHVLLLHSQRREPNKNSCGGTTSPLPGIRSFAGQKSFIRLPGGERLPR